MDLKEFECEKIKILDTSEIDISKWDKYVSNTGGWSLYCKSWYLNAITQNSWKALIYGDYEGVIPFITTKKVFFNFCYPSPLTKQNDFLFRELGFSEKSNVYLHLTKHFSRIELLTPSWIENSGFTSSKKINHVIPLEGKTIQNIRGNYNRNTKRNINNAVLNEIYISEIFNIKEISKFIISCDNTKFFLKYPHILPSLLPEILEKGRGKVYGAFKNKDLTAIGIFVVEDLRVYFLICCSNQVGKDTKSMFLLIDEAISFYCNLGMSVFDFTGSSIKSIARRNLGFGSIEEVYYHAVWNHSALNFIGSLIKRRKQ